MQISFEMVSDAHVRQLTRLRYDKLPCAFNMDVPPGTLHVHVSNEYSVRKLSFVSGLCKDQNSCEKKACLLDKLSHFLQCSDILVF